MNLFDEQIKENIRLEIIEELSTKHFEIVNRNILNIQQQLYANIPDNKRISYGTYYTIKVLGEYLSEKFQEENFDLFDIGSNLFDHSDHHINFGIALTILSFYGLTNYKRIFPYFEK